MIIGCNVKFKEYLQNLNHTHGTFISWVNRDEELYDWLIEYLDFVIAEKIKACISKHTIKKNTKQPYILRCI